MKRFFALSFLAFVIIGTASPQGEQAQPRRRRPVEITQTAPDPQFTQQRADPTPADIRFEKEMEKARNKERHESLKKDTDKLHKLATELKEGVDKSSKDMLSLEVIKKCEEIEKLAKNVREKMKGY